MNVIFLTLAAATAVGAAGCATTPPPPVVVSTESARPLDTLPGGADLALVRDDLIATARALFGSPALASATNSPTFLIAKRFAGMVPPPTPTALLMRADDGWKVATSDGWRTANAEAAAELDVLLADRSFWTAPVVTPACPDFGAANLLLKVVGRAETVRNAMCTSRADKMVGAALRA